MDTNGNGQQNIRPDAFEGKEIEFPVTFQLKAVMVGTEDSKNKKKLENVFEQYGVKYAFTEKKESFKLTEQSFKKLKDENIPKDILNALEPLENKEISDKEKFIDVIKTHIGEEQTVKYETLILKHTERKTYNPAQNKNLAEIRTQLKENLQQPPPWMMRSLIEEYRKILMY